MDSTRRRLRHALALTLAAMMAAASAWAHVVTVRPDGSGDVPTIQAGVDQIESTSSFFPDTLLVMPGTYEEDVELGLSLAPSRTAALRSLQLKTAALLRHARGAPIDPAAWRAAIQSVEDDGGPVLLCPGGPDSTLVRGIAFNRAGGDWVVEGAGVVNRSQGVLQRAGLTWRRCHFLSGVDHFGDLSLIGYRDCRFDGDSRLAGAIWVEDSEFSGGTLELAHSENGYLLERCSFHDSPGEALRVRVSTDTDLRMTRCRIEQAGTGMRFITDGAWGYASIDNTTIHDIRGAAISDTNVTPCLFPQGYVGLDVQDSHIQNCGMGVQWMDPHSILHFESDTLLDVRESAMSATGDYLSLSDLQLARIGGDGVVLAGSPCDATWSIVSGCRVQDTGSVGLRCTISGGPMLIHDNAFVRNASGGMVVTGRDPHITSNVITGAAGAGLVAKLQAWPDPAVIDSNTIVANQGAGIVLGPAEAGDIVQDPSVSRNIVAFNQGAGIVSQGVTPFASSDDVYRNAGGATSGFSADPSWIASDPMLCDPAGGDFQVGALSLCASSGIGATGVGCDAPKLDAEVWQPGASSQWRAHEHENVPLAIRGSRYFDVTRVDPSTVRLAGATPITQGGKRPKTEIHDIDHDGEPDLLVWFDFDDLRLSGPTATQAEASTRDGNRYVGPVFIGPTDTGPVVDRGVASPGAGAAPVFALMGATPNPCQASDLAIRFSLPSDEPSTLELIDVAGRVVARREVGALGAGEHRVGFAAETVPASGVYWARLRQGDRRAMARLVIVR
jgi:hypothetical protein